MSYQGGVADAAAELSRAIADAEQLIAQPDVIAADATGSAAVSSAPWNTAAANAALDAHQLTRRLEASLRLAVTGRSGPVRGGSDACTASAIRAITRLAEAVTEDGAALAARLMDGATAAVDRLPAIDTAQVWRRVTAPCPYCGFGMLRYAPGSGVVTCLRFGVCFDGDGRHPQGQLGVNGVTGEGIVAWHDGLITP